VWWSRSASASSWRPKRAEASRRGLRGEPRGILAKAAATGHAARVTPRVVYDRERLVVVDKDAGVRSEDVAAALSLKLAHRIDMSTSGLLVLCRDARTVARLHKQLRAGLVLRRYRFVADGVVAAGALVSVLVRDRGDGLRGSALDPQNASSGKAAHTDVEDVVVHGALCSGVARLHTGRTHQLRIQLAEAGAPLVGERVYTRDARASGQALSASARLLLHAEHLAFVHPNTKEPLAFTAPLPADFVAAAAGLGVVVV
jgi:23S rRNA pseudouridine1911/1915/1917 synthase